MMKNWQEEQFDVMWSFLQKGGMKSNIPCLKEHCMMLRQMLMQKTAGQRKDKKNDLPFEQSFWSRTVRDTDREVQRARKFNW